MSASTVNATVSTDTLETGLPPILGQDAPATGKARTHFRRIPAKPFLASEKGRTTILFGTITKNHEAMIEAAFRRAGYRCQALPLPRTHSFHVGREYCNNGLCNPVYYTAGNLVEYLRSLEEKGMSRQQIIENYVYFTASGCGPCRFGMYESEYGQALENAGFEGFRVLTFQSNQGVYQQEKTGLDYTMDFGLGMFMALHLGDVLYQLPYEIRPYEVNAGETDRVLAEVRHDIAEFLSTRPYFDVLRDSPTWLSNWFRKHDGWKRWSDNLGKFRQHCFGDDLRELLEGCAARLNAIEVNLLRPRPVVKIVGEFYSMVSEGDCNFNMFRFLEGEGAQVTVDPIASLVTYWLRQPGNNLERRRGLKPPYPEAPRWALHQHLANQHAWRGKRTLFALAENAWAWQYHRVAKRLSMDTLPRLLPQAELDRLAAPHYNPLLRGGEGHLEIAKAIHASSNHKAHMVLSLKPFGCMPSTQSDGVAAAVVSQHPGLLFLSIETSGEGEINALSRVQMVLAEARAKARQEFDAAVREGGYSLAQMEAFTLRDTRLRRPFNSMRKRKDVTGVGAAFVLNLAERMRRAGIRPEPEGVTA
jgi:predicted nucleotide-binding protein (sugar kinase/HSP70/actin superfamily)